MSKDKIFWAVSGAIIVILAFTIFNINYSLWSQHSLEVLNQKDQDELVARNSKPKPDLDYYSFLLENYGIDWKLPSDIEYISFYDLREDNNYQDGATQISLSFSTKDDTFSGSISVYNKYFFAPGEVCPGNREYDNSPSFPKDKYMLSDGTKFTICETHGKQPDMFEYYSSFITLSNGVTIDYRTSITPESGDKSTVLQKYKEILATLKFTNFSLTPDWKTYVNTEFGFEIKIPSDWIAKRSGPEWGCGFLFFYSKITNKEIFRYTDQCASEGKTREIINGLEWSYNEDEASGMSYSIKKGDGMNGFSMAILPENKLKLVKVLSNFKFIK